MLVRSAMALFPPRSTVVAPSFRFHVAAVAQSSSWSAAAAGTTRRSSSSLVASRAAAAPAPAPSGLRVAAAPYHSWTSPRGPQSQRRSALLGGGLAASSNSRRPLGRQQPVVVLATQAEHASCFSSSSPFGRGGGGGGGGGKSGGSRAGAVATTGIGLLGAASVVAGKSKYLLGALKLTKLSSLGSMVLTIGTYSAFFGLPYAVGIVGLVLVHECGHVYVMRRRGIDFSPMVFVPFVGAFIAMRDRPRDAWEDALVAFGGPVLGGAGAGAVALAASATDSQLLFALADFGFMVNLFNLLPIGAMDGGRIASALSPYAGVAGLGVGGALAYAGAVHNPIFYLILLAGGYETFQRFYDPGRMPPNYYKISPVRRAALSASYFGLVAALLAGMAANHRRQKPPEVLARERQLQEATWDMR